MMKAASPCRSLTRSARRLCTGAIATAVVLVGLFDLALAWQAARAQHRIAQSVQIHGLTLSGDISLAQTDRAIALTSQPEPASLLPLLQAQLRRAPALDYLVLTQPATGAVVMAVRPGLSPPAPSLLSMSGRADRDTRLAGGRMDMAWQLPDLPGWWLHAGSSPQEQAFGEAHVAGLVSALLLLWLMGTVLLLWHLCRRRLFRRLAAILAAAASAAAGDWRPRLADNGLDDAGRLAAALNGALARVRGQCQHFLWLADEMTQAMPEWRADILEKRRRLAAATSLAALSDAERDDAA